MQLTYSNQFKKDAKKAKKQHKNLDLVTEAVGMLMQNQAIPLKLRDHALSGNYIGHREMHLEPDWLLIYKINTEELRLVRVGRHSELFK
ncbi:MAG TPA: type II toxin-antitoxin system YafQ family toxin [Aquella sp.]|nr:type II toxin-antitoxin system YafQ family toxin [Aquella sp.]